MVLRLRRDSRTCAELHAVARTVLRKSKGGERSSTTPKISSKSPLCRHGERSVGFVSRDTVQLLRFPDLSRRQRRKIGCDDNLRRHHFLLALLVVWASRLGEISEMVETRILGADRTCGTVQASVASFDQGVSDLLSFYSLQRGA